jgi:lipopolysaccharide heptosyltransferase II
MTTIPAYDRILISRMKFIGDVVLTTPAIRAVREQYPGAFIAYMGDAQAVSLLGHNPHLNEIIPFDFSRPAWREQPRVAALLRRRRFDLAIDLFGNPRSALLMFLSGARTRVGLDRPGRGRLYTVRVRDDGSPKNAVAFHLQYLRAAGIPAVSTQPEIFLTADERAEASALLHKAGGDDRPCVALHPGATWPAKRWLPERFARLAVQAHTCLGVRVILTAGPGDGEVIHDVQQAMTTPLPVFAGLPLRQLAALLGACSACVANDSGPMHIAAAVGTPTIGIFGPGEENIWFPYDATAGHAALRHDVVCHPCHLDFCNREGDFYMECMKGLTQEDVYRALAQAVNNRSTPVR